MVDNCVEKVIILGGGGHHGPRGFRALLINQALAGRCIDMSGRLLCDSAARCTGPDCRSAHRLAMRAAIAAASSEVQHFWTNGSFAGLGYLSEHPLPALVCKTESVRATEELFRSIRRQQKDLVSALPTHHDLLHRLHAGQPA